MRTFSNSLETIHPFESIQLGSLQMCTFRCVFYRNLEES